MHLNVCTQANPLTLDVSWQVTNLLLLWRQPCVSFYSFHMHSPSSPFILSSSWREEKHQLMFSITVIGWLQAASVNCAPPPNLPTALHLHSAILFHLLTFHVYFGSLYFFSSKTGNVTQECVGRMILRMRGCCMTVACLDDFCLRGILKKI